VICVVGSVIFLLRVVPRMQSAKAASAQA